MKGKRTNTQDTQKDMAAGTTTVSTMFKSKDDEVVVANKLERYERDIEVL